MIGWVIGAIALIWFFAKNSVAISIGQQQPSINATGASLSSALGTQAKPPSYYATGNPGYNAGPTGAPTAQLVVPSFQPKVVQQAIPTTQHVANASMTQASNIARAGAANRFAPPLVLSQVRTRLAGPETATAFWTRAPQPRYFSA